jgi:hypothetical protein
MDVPLLLENPGFLNPLELFLVDLSYLIGIGHLFPPYWINLREGILCERK